MALSDQLSQLAARTKALEIRAVAAGDKARDELQREVQAARATSDADAVALGKALDAREAEVAAWWTDMGRAWDEHIARMRERVEQKKEQHDLKAAQRDAEDAVEYASYLIDYTLAAVEEAEYAVLDAVLAQKRADELAAAQPAS
ncbi:hypothetical protein MRQ36_28685 [Micromonospora sp. R77]|uniref:hypothetical protein n=1 Tax=Micromonospora sp. R77 TaxID=2925836 RepID=UPI001F60C85D|nr:hypothetical protein [Micromonospora sp. R77]MCI4066312.1 hypothetical protein [Micromonospora sp. R77]MCI4066314.1 hypothetical protein [Micromonospora sp. R77]